MKHGSLFSGIGGFDLAAQWMGWENVFHCEWNEFGQNVLKYYWPKAISYEDITKTDFTIHRGRIDILTGGFPCQPYSTAGKRKGKEDERHLWPEMLRAIREIKPRYIVGENVSGLLSWSGGLVFEEVCTDLENEGYEVQPVLLPAASVGAPHRRDRIWFVSRLISDSSSDGRNGNKESKERLNSKRSGVSFNEFDSLCIGGIASNTKRSCIKGECIKGQGKGKLRGCHCKNDAADTKRSGGRKIYSKMEKGQPNGNSINSIDEQNYWEEFPTQAPICDGDDGLSSKLDGITFPRWRTESIKGAGNAIVPQVSLQIFKALEQLELNEN